MGANPPEQLAGRIINQHHIQPAVQHGDPGLHALDNMLVEPGQFIDLDGLASGQHLCLADPGGQQHADERGHEKARAEDPGMHIIERRRKAEKLHIKLMPEHGQGGDGREKDGDPAGAQNTAARDRDHQQHAKTAVQPAARVHQQAQHDNIDQRVGGNLPVKARRPAGDEQAEGERRQQIGMRGLHKQRRVECAKRRRQQAGIGAQHKQAGQKQAIDIKIAQRAPSGRFAVKIRRVARGIHE